MSSETTHTLTTSEYLKIYLNLPHYPPTKLGKRREIRDQAILATLWHTGLRVGELVRLLASDLIWGTEPVLCLTVREAIAKKGHERRIPISAELSRHLRRLPYSWFDDHLGSGHTFAFQHRTPYTHVSERHVQRLIRNAAALAINRNVHPHMFRHSFGTRMMRVTNSRVVQQLLGHRHLSSTQIYTHPDQKDLQDAIDAAGEMPDPIL
jgi:site-specific recombinase XerD